MQPQANPIPQNLGNEEEIVEPSQNPVEIEKEPALPSPDKLVEPILEGDIPSSSRDRGKSKVGKESPHLEKEAQNPYVKVTKRKRSIPTTTTPTTSTLVAPKPKWTHKTIEVKEVLVCRSPRIQGQVSSVSIENLNASISKSHT